MLFSFLLNLTRAILRFGQAHQSFSDAGCRSKAEFSWSSKTSTLVLEDWVRLHSLPRNFACLQEPKKSLRHTKEIVGSGSWAAFPADTVSEAVLKSSCVYQWAKEWMLLKDLLFLLKFTCTSLSPVMFRTDQRRDFGVQKKRGYSYQSLAFNLWRNLAHLLRIGFCWGKGKEKLVFPVLRAFPESLCKWSL